MKFIRRFIRRILLFVIIIIVVLVIGRNIIIKYAAPITAKMASGISLSLKKVDIGLLSSHIGVDGVQIQNPPDFPDEPLIVIPKIYLDYDLASMFTSKVKLHELSLDLAEFTIVKNKNGAYNVSELITTKERRTEVENKPEKEEPESSKKELQIDTLKIKIGKVVIKDLSGNGPPKIAEYNLNIDENIKNAQVHSLVPYIGAKVVLAVLINAKANASMAKILSEVLMSFEVADLGSAASAIFEIDNISKEASNSLDGAVNFIKSIDF